MPGELESVIAEVHEHGLLVNNLFELSPGKWQANVRSDSELAGWEFGHGATASEALSAALVNALRDHGREPLHEQRDRSEQSANAARSTTKSAEELGL